MNVLIDYLQRLESNLGPIIKRVTKQVLDEESLTVFNTMKNGTPVSNKEHVHLVDTLKMVKIDDGRKYGHKIDYDGYNEEGTPYSLIARSLNKGNAMRAGTKHIDRAVHKLKGIDDRINDRVIEAIDKLE